MAASIHCTCTPDKLCGIHETLRKCLRQSGKTELTTQLYKKLVANEKCTCTDLYWCPVCRSKALAKDNEELIKKNWDLQVKINALEMIIGGTNLGF